MKKTSPRAFLSQNTALTNIKRHEYVSVSSSSDCCSSCWLLCCVYMRTSTQSVPSRSLLCCLTLHFRHHIRVWTLRVSCFSVYGLERVYNVQIRGLFFWDSRYLGPQFLHTLFLKRHRGRCVFFLVLRCNFPVFLGLFLRLFGGLSCRLRAAWRGRIFLLVLGRL